MRPLCVLTAHLVVLPAGVDAGCIVRELDTCDGAALVRHPGLDMLVVPHIPDGQLTAHITCTTGDQTLEFNDIC